jgi:hypothetical protein
MSAFASTLAPNENDEYKRKINAMKLRINNALDKSFFIDSSGVCRPYVCLSCDRFLDFSQVRYILADQLEKVAFLLFPQRQLPEEIIKYYTYNGKGTSVILRECLLSPKGCYLGDGKKKKFIICESCRHCLREKSLVPESGICNRYEIGAAPSQLEELTDIELAFIAEVHCHAHVYAFTGGHTGIKGWHSLVKTNIVKKREVLEQMDLLMELPNQLIVVLHGEMTDNQKRKVIKNCFIRRDKCKAALDWLVLNNIHYKDYIVNIENLKEPLIIDKSTGLESVDNNVELQQELTVVFPDATLDPSTAGYETVEEYKKVIDSLNSCTFKAEINIPESKYVRDFESSNFVVAFPRHFPFGYGGPEEVRTLQKDGSLGLVLKDKYVAHLINLSNLHFQEPLFTLVCFNLFHRQKMVESSCWRVRSKEGRSQRISDLTPDIVLDEIRIRNARRIHAPELNRDASEFLGQISAMSKALPHTNEAATKGRKDVLSMQANFGFPDIFFTISPPDDNSFIITVYCGIEELPQNVNILTEEELTRLAKYRDNLRFKYPGVSTLNFERVLNVVMKEIVGWNNKLGGFFGKPKAYFYSVEEQARKTLHVHMLIWINDLPYVKDDLPYGMDDEKRKSNLAMCRLKNYVDRVQSCCLIGNKFRTDSHKCVKRFGKVLVKSNQALRFLRHKEGCRTERCAMAYCPDCEKEWTSDELALCHLIIKKRKSVPAYGSIITDEISPEQTNVTESVLTYGSVNTIRNSDQETIEPEVKRNKGFVTVLKEKARLGKRFLSEVIYQSKLAGTQVEVADEVNVNYNVHSTSHVRSCFRDKSPECRYKFPKKGSKRTRIDFPDEGQDWFSYTGVCCKRRIIEIFPQRGAFDVCMNNYCPIVSQTKLACNSNVSVLVNGVQAFYVTKYATKKTQEDDKSEYEPMIRYVEKRLLSSKFPDSTVSESMSRVIGACLAHNSKNVISATMAKFLINNSSRFGMSHTIFYVPLYEMKRVLENHFIMLKISQTKVSGPRVRNYIEGTSLHYLFRPDKLESISLLDFIVNYDVRRRKDGFNLEDEDCFKDGHPAREYQHLVERTTSVIPGINNWEFIDSAAFKGELLEPIRDTDPYTITNPQIEDYAKTVLLLCHPFRSKEDLMHNGSYVLKFRSQAKVISDKYGLLLQNIQDIRNAVRCQRTKDELEKETKAFKSETNADDSDNEDEIDENERQYLDGLFSNMTSFDGTNTSDQCLNNHSLNIPVKFNLQDLRNKGAHKCGYENVCDFQYNSNDTELVEIEEEGNQNTSENTYSNDNQYPKLSIESMYRVLITTVKRKVNISDRAGDIQSVNNDLSVSGDESINLETTSTQFKLEATGTVESMKLRAKQAHFDNNQRKAFLMMLSHFVLSYIEEVEEHTEDSTLRSTTHYSTIRREKKKLFRCGGKLQKLRLFLDGAGGSGKSEVLKEVLRYAQDFCTNLHVPFTKHTILMTASTGVAATLINGNTVHSACSLYKKTTDLDREIFKEVRLLILDEISMIDIKLLRKLDGKLRDLRELSEFYGGMNIVFVGDFRQLDPVNAIPIYKDLLSPEWMIAVNSYIELLGMYRFADDIVWGETLKRFRNGIPLSNDFHYINERVVGLNGYTQDGDPIPHDISYSTPSNKERDAINAGIFSKIVEKNAVQTIAIFSDKLGVKKLGESKYTPVTNSLFWEECGESDCIFNKKTTRLDPVLKVYIGCPLMLIDNIDVDNRLANGTQAILVKVVLKAGQTTSDILINGVLTKAVLASQVSYLLLRHLPTNGEAGTEFKLKPKQHSGFSAMMPRPVSLRGKSKRTKMTFSANQIPVVVNNATTGHKLQGCSKSSLFINCFSYAKNWPYVVLSRVKTKKGLYLRRPLDESKDYSVDVKLARMRQIFSTYKQVPDEYFNSEDDQEL